MIRRWSVYRANLDPVIGSEQGKSRPVLVISEDAINDLLNIVNVIPITSRKPGRRIYPNEVLIPANNFGLNNESIILCHQIRTLDKQRLSTLYGVVTDPGKRNEILDALCFQLGIERG
ncbi:type II toxin-antitoxin system PemK/MazF family toxin [Dyadobacter luticola]|uniref:mRNA interferase n=1 Tax=Dyadobacter luticola TaxID=1979387 RepID=A0A5R9L5G9_9BACT|nr:type II toxin-antitoxin system PemK/MazF family toxin [Dyadobacter luticola]TLV03495.1 type II toxin-antitoxin system PemK/MazF family toxin [Dyadobacter luticola]